MLLVAERNLCHSRLFSFYRLVLALSTCNSSQLRQRCWACSGAAGSRPGRTGSLVLPAAPSRCGPWCQWLPLPCCLPYRLCSTIPNESYFTWSSLPRALCPSLLQAQGPPFQCVCVNKYPSWPAFSNGLASLSFCPKGPPPPCFLASL